MLYSKQKTKMIEDDIFKIIVPLNDEYSSDYGTPLPQSDASSSKLVLNEVQKSIVELIRPPPHITLEGIANSIGLSRRTIATKTKELQDLGIISHSGSKKIACGILLKHKFPRNKKSPEKHSFLRGSHRKKKRT